MWYVVYVGMGICGYVCGMCLGMICMWVCVCV